MSNLPWDMVYVVCHICHQPHRIKELQNRYRRVHCLTYSWWYNGYPYHVQSDYCERRQTEDQEEAWELLAKSLTPAPEYEDQPVYKIRCSKCNGWFDSDYNMPGSCYQCATVKEEL